VRVATAQRGKQRPLSHDDLAAGEVEIEEVLQVLLPGDAADREEDRSGSEQPHLARAEAVGIRILVATNAAASACSNSPI
jgi:hypothetical protein